MLKCAYVAVHSRGDVYNKYSLAHSITPHNTPNVLEFKYPTMLLAVLETLLKMISPEMSEGQGDASHELSRDEV